MSRALFKLPKFRKGNTVINIQTNMPEKIIMVERTTTNMYGSIYYYVTTSGIYEENELRENKL